MKILNSKNHVIRDIYQYDVGIYVDTDGISNDGFMHFSKTNSEADIVSMAIEDGKAQVPNQMIEKAGTLYIYVYDEERTLHAAKTEIIARPKPPEYVEDPTPVITYPELVELVEELERYKNLSADVDADTGTPSVEVEQAEDGYMLHFHNLKGEKGPQGEKGEKGEDAVVDPTLSVEGEAADAKAAGDAIREINRRTIGVNHVSNQTILRSAAADDGNAILRLVGNDGAGGKVYAVFVFEDPDGEGPLRVYGIEDPDEDDAAVNKKYADAIKAIAESKYTLPINGIPTSDIADGAITNNELANGAVTSTKIADGTIQGAKLADGTVYSSKIGANAVTTEKINDLAITTGKLGPAAVTAPKIADSAVTETKLANPNTILLWTNPDQSAGMGNNTVVRFDTEISFAVYKWITIEFSMTGTSNEHCTMTIPAETFSADKRYNAVTDYGAFSAGGAARGRQITGLWRDSIRFGIGYEAGVQNALRMVPTKIWARK